MTSFCRVAGGLPLLIERHRQGGGALERRVQADQPRQVHLAVLARVFRVGRPDRAAPRADVARQALGVVAADRAAVVDGDGVGVAAVVREEVVQPGAVVTQPCGRKLPVSPSPTIAPSELMAVAWLNCRRRACRGGRRSRFARRQATGPALVAGL